MSRPSTRNPKASQYYTNITIRSLASGASRTFSINDVYYSYNFPLATIVAPDKNGGMYVIPTQLWDTGLSVYTYLEGVYSPFETAVYNAIGDTPAKFAADGTNTINQALNNLFNNYIGKINTLQMQGMQAKYLKDLGSVKSIVMAFTAEMLGSVSTAVATTKSMNVRTDVETRTPAVTQTSTQVQYSNTS